MSDGDVNTSPPPLAGLRVLEIAPPSAGAVTRYIAELGADVIHVPQAEIVDDTIAALVANTSKRIMRLDLASGEGRERLGDTRPMPTSSSAHGWTAASAIRSPTNGWLTSARAIHG